MERDENRELPTFGNDITADAFWPDGVWRSDLEAAFIWVAELWEIRALQLSSRFDPDFGIILLNDDVIDVLLVDIRRFEGMGSDTITTIIDEEGLPSLQDCDPAAVVKVSCRLLAHLKVRYNQLLQV